MEVYSPILLFGCVVFVTPLRNRVFFGCGDPEVVLSFHYLQIRNFSVALNAKHFNLEAYFSLDVDVVLYFSCESGHVD